MFSPNQEQAKAIDLAHAQNLDSGIEGNCFNYNWTYRQSTKMILDFRERLGNFLQLCYLHLELIH